MELLEGLAGLLCLFCLAAIVHWSEDGWAVGSWATHLDAFVMILRSDCADRFALGSPENPGDPRMPLFKDDLLDRFSMSSDGSEQESLLRSRFAICFLLFHYQRKKEGQLACCTAPCPAGSPSWPGICDGLQPGVL